MMEPLIAWAFLSTVTERMIEVIVRAFPVLDDIKFSQIDIKLVMAFAFGMLFAFGAGLNFFEMFGISFSIPYVGQVVSAVFIMAGSNYISDLISALKSKQI